jgi:hypothetical protein
VANCSLIVNDTSMDVDGVTWNPTRIEFALTWDSTNQVATMSYTGVKA